MAGPRFTDGQRLGLIAEQAGQWRARILHPAPIVPGSTLAEDDAVFPNYSVSQLVWQGLCSGVEHLEVFTSALRDTGTGFPFGYFTLARAGLQGAAHALWLLDADPLQRRRRGLKLAHEDYLQESKALADMARLMPDVAEQARERIELLEQRTGELVSAGAGLDMTSGQVTARINDTEIIEAMSRRIATGEDAENLIAGFVLMWRRHSGSAHGLRWSLLLRSTIVREDAGGTHARITADSGELMMAASGVSLMLMEAFKLYDRYRTGCQLPRPATI